MSIFDSQKDKPDLFKSYFQEFIVNWPSTHKLNEVQEQIIQMGALNTEIWSSICMNVSPCITGGLHSFKEDTGGAAVLRAAPASHTSTALQGPTSIFTLAFCCHTKGISLWRLGSSPYTFPANFGIHWPGRKCSPPGKGEMNTCFPGQWLVFPFLAWFPEWGL